MADVVTCSDCGETLELAPCTVCDRPICGSHRTGTGRLKDGYQCAERDCWVTHAQRVFPMLRRLSVLRGRFPYLYSTLEDLETSEGWDPLLTQLSEKLEALIVQQPEAERAKYGATQVKQKYGMLSVCLQGDQSYAMTSAILEAQLASAWTCEVCGAAGTLGRPREPGPVRALCPEHHEAARGT